METVKLFDAEWNLMEIVWETAPTTASRIAAIAGQRFDWAKNTTYTVLKRLCQRGIFQNQDGVVTALVSKEEFYARQSEEFVEETFSGSLPAFLTAFTRRKKLSQEEITQLQQLIDESRG